MSDRNENCEVCGKPHGSEVDCENLKGQSELSLAHGSAIEAWSSEHPLKYHPVEGYNAMPPIFEQAWNKGRRPLLELLKETLPYLDSVCELDAVGSGDDNCGVLRANALRDMIRAVLPNDEAQRRRDREASSETET